MAILVAPDSFKGTATATEAAYQIARGLRAGWDKAPQHSNAHQGDLCEQSLTICPLADGGEGTSFLLAQHAGGAECIELPTTDAYGRLSSARYYLKDSTAYIDVAAASGLPATQVGDPKHADTYGTGVLIADAQARGAAHIVLGLGGSATVDGGMGILTALGANGHDNRGYALPKGGAPLVNLHEIDLAQLNIKAAALDFTLLADTKCPPQHAAALYGPQKGAQGQDIALLTGALLQLCDVTGTDPSRTFFGAAGGVPIALTWLSASLWGNEDHIRIVSGAEYMCEQLGIRELLPPTDDRNIIVTGEGAFDAQSITGKVVGTLSDIAATLPAELFIVAGKVDHEEVTRLAARLPSPVTAIELPAADTLEEQFHRAGQKIAQALIR
ncbi:MAG: glycerate kinase [Corynebacterium sp.]|nr:glycerate kinase [Corynebacterium sp.]